MVSCGIKRCPPTPFDINRLHHVVAVTAEVASSSLVVPAILSKTVTRLSLKPTRVQKGAFLHPLCTLFLQLERFSRAQLSQFDSVCETAVGFVSEAKTSASTAACAACFAGEIACV
jgi:hypothetical protein